MGVPGLVSGGLQACFSVCGCLVCWCVGVWVQIVGVCDMTHSCWEGVHSTFVVSRIHLCDRTHSMCTWLIHMCDMTHSWVWHALFVLRGCPFNFCGVGASSGDGGFISVCVSLQVYRCVWEFVGLQVCVSLWVYRCVCEFLSLHRLLWYNSCI